MNTTRVNSSTETSCVYMTGYTQSIVVDHSCLGLASQEEAAMSVSCVDMPGGSSHPAAVLSASCVDDMPGLAGHPVAWRRLCLFGIMCLHDQI